jgi:hypothetical protein
MNLKTAIASSGLTMGLLVSPGVAFAQSAQSSSTVDTAPSGSDSSLRLSTGVNYSKGDYGEIEDTEVFSVPVSLTYRTGNFKVRVSVPWVRIDGPGSLLQTPEGRDGGGGSGSGSDNSGSGSSGSGSGSGSGNSGSGSSGSGGIDVEDNSSGDLVDDDGVAGNNGVTLANNRRSGIGDVNVAMTYSFDLGGDLYFEPTAKVKLPTASVAKRLGTGQVDFTLAADLVKDVGPASFYLHGRRKFAGKPDGSTIRSTWGLGGGASVKAAPGVTIGADYDWQESAFLGRQASSEVTGWANFRISRSASLTLFASTGLNANSADFAAGTSISFRF